LIRTIKVKTQEENQFHVLCVLGVRQKKGGRYRKQDMLKNRQPGMVGYQWEVLEGKKAKKEYGVRTSKHKNGQVAVQASWPRRRT